MITEEIRQNIIKELGIENLSKEKSDGVMQKLEENIQRSLVLEILDLLSPQDQQQLNAILESGDNAKVKLFLEEKIAGFELLVKSVAQSAVREFKDLAK